MFYNYSQIHHIKVNITTLNFTFQLSNSDHLLFIIKFKPKFFNLLQNSDQNFLNVLQLSLIHI